MSVETYNSIRKVINPILRRLFHIELVRIMFGSDGSEWIGIGIRWQR